MVLIDGATIPDLLGRQPLTLTGEPVIEGAVLVDAGQFSILALTIPDQAHHFTAMLLVYPLNDFASEFIHVFERSLLNFFDKIIGLCAAKVILVSVILLEEA